MKRVHHAIQVQISKPVVQVGQVTEITTDNPGTESYVTHFQ